MNRVEEVQPFTSGLGPITFVESGQKLKREKTKKVASGIIDAATDWVYQINLRHEKTHFPPDIITTSERSDIVLFSNSTKLVVIIELTSPAEDNIEKLREIKSTKYERLAENIREGGIMESIYYVFTVEIGVKGFVPKRTSGVWRRLGLNEKEGKRLTNKISRTAIRCSHFIWIRRNTAAWEAPTPRVTSHSG